MTREDQFAFIERGKAAVLTGASRYDVPLHCVEFVVPFVPGDLSLSVWLFNESDEQLGRAEAIGWSSALRDEFVQAIRSIGYAEEWLGAINFTFDSHESVVRDYEGSYFYRLR